MEPSTITANCLTIEELESQLDQLKKDLDLIGAEARKRYGADELLLDDVLRKQTNV